MGLIRDLVMFVFDILQYKFTLFGYTMSFFNLFVFSLLVELFVLLFFRSSD